MSKPENVCVFSRKVRAFLGSAFWQQYRGKGSDLQGGMWVWGGLHSPSLPLVGPSVLYLCDADNAHPIHIFFSLVARLRIELAPPVLEAWNLNHWTTWEVPLFSYSSLYNTHFFSEI